MRRVIVGVAVLALACGPALAFPPPDEAELERHRTIMQRYIDRGVPNGQIPEQMRLWFGRQFKIVCNFKRHCDLYVYQGEGLDTWDYHRVGPLPREQ